MSQYPRYHVSAYSDSLGSAIDPSLPTYVKIPGDPIPRSWVHTILHHKVPTEDIASTIGQK